MQSDGSEIAIEANEFSEDDSIIDLVLEYIESMSQRVNELNCGSCGQGGNNGTLVLCGHCGGAVHVTCMTQNLARRAFVQMARPILQAAMDMNIIHIGQAEEGNQGIEAIEFSSSNSGSMDSRTTSGTSTSNPSEFQSFDPQEDEATASSEATSEASSASGTGTEMDQDSNTEGEPDTKPRPS